MVVSRPCSRVAWWVALLAVSIPFGVGILTNRAAPPGGPLHDESLDRVVVGMSRDQVQGVVGPPRDAWKGRRASPYASQFRQRGYESWVGRDSELLILFDGEGVAADVKRVPTFSTSNP